MSNSFVEFLAQEAVNYKNSTTDFNKDYHWYQNAQNPFWKTPVWEVQTQFDAEFNRVLLDEIYDIGRKIATGEDKDPHNSIWDYSYPNLNRLKEEIINIVSRAIAQEVPEVRKLNIRSCEHFMGWINVREPGEVLEVHGHTESAIADINRPSTGAYLRSTRLGVSLSVPFSQSIAAPESNNTKSPEFSLACM